MGYLYVIMKKHLKTQDMRHYYSLEHRNVVTSGGTVTIYMIELLCKVQSHANTRRKILKIRYFEIAFGGLVDVFFNELAFISSQLQ